MKKNIIGGNRKIKYYRGGKPNKKTLEGIVGKKNLQGVKQNTTTLQG
jgi:hypothetical protein